MNGVFVMSLLKIKTPCVGLCSTIYGDLVCRGCKRYHQEIIDWNAYDVEQRNTVILRLESLLVPLVMAHLEVTDAALLKAQLEKRHIRFLPEQSPYCWAYNLLVRGAAHIRCLEAYGLRWRESVIKPDLIALRDFLDKTYFLRAETWLAANKKDTAI